MSAFDDPTLREIGKRLPPPDFSAARKADLRAKVLATVKQTPQRPVRSTRPWALAAAAVLLLAGAAWRWSLETPPAAPALVAAPEPPKTPAPSPEPRRHAASVVASGEATFTHELLEGGALERVVLEAGTIRLDVDVPEGRRFLLVTQDAEVRLAASSFEASAEGGALSRLDVLTGRVELVREGQAPHVVAREERWRRPPEAPSEGPVAQRAPPRRPRRAPPPKRPEAEPVVAKPPEPPPASAPRDVTPQSAERAFQEGWSAFAAREFSKAAEGFAAADVPESPVAEEARYWRGIALVRAERFVEAEAALARFFDLHPDSRRRLEVALLIGQLCVRRAATVEAQRWLEMASTSPDRRIQERAQAALEGLSEQ